MGAIVRRRTPPRKPRRRRRERLRGDARSHDAQCQQEQREVLTPLAATRLFGISPAAVRAARLQGKVKPELTVSITAKHAHLINLESALRYWRLPEAMARTLTLKRSRGTPVAVGSQFYVILHAGEAIQPFDPGG